MLITLNEGCYSECKFRVEFEQTWIDPHYNPFDPRYGWGCPQGVTPVVYLNDEEIWRGSQRILSGCSQEILSIKKEMISKVFTECILSYIRE